MRNAWVGVVVCVVEVVVYMCGWGWWVGVVVCMCGCGVWVHSEENEWLNCPLLTCCVPTLRATLSTISMCHIPLSTCTQKITREVEEVIRQVKSQGSSSSEASTPSLGNVSMIRSLDPRCLPVGTDSTKPAVLWTPTPCQP